MSAEEHEPGRQAHPETRDLLRFLRGELARAENRRIVRHLLTGCPRCLAVTRPLWELGSGPRAGKAGPRAGKAEKGGRDACC